MLHIAAGVTPASPSAAEPTSPAAETAPASAQQRPQSPPAAEPQWKFLRRERTNGQRWGRAFLLPEDADADGITVRLERGVLTIHVPRRAPPPKPVPRRIAVNA